VSAAVPRSPSVAAIVTMNCKPSGTVARRGSAASICPVRAETVATTEVQEFARA